MVKLVELINSEKEILEPSKPTEIVETSSEKDGTTNYKSYTYCIAEKIQFAVRNVIKNRNEPFRILVTADEHDEKNVNIEKVVILFREKNEANFIKEEVERIVNEYNKDAIISYIIDPTLSMVDNKYSSYKTKQQNFTNSIKHYLVSEYRFYGTVKVECAYVYGETIRTKIVATGKGVNDFMMRGLHKLEKENWLHYNSNDEDKYFSLIDKCF